MKSLFWFVLLLATLAYTGHASAQRESAKSNDVNKALTEKLDSEVNKWRQKLPTHSYAEMVLLRARLARYWYIEAKEKVDLIFAEFPNLVAEQKAIALELEKMARLAGMPNEEFKLQNLEKLLESLRNQNFERYRLVQELKRIWPPLHRQVFAVTLNELFDFAKADRWKEGFDMANKRISEFSVLENEDSKIPKLLHDVEKDGPEMALLEFAEKLNRQADILDDPSENLKKLEKLKILKGKIETDDLKEPARLLLLKNLIKGPWKDVKSQFTENLIMNRRQDILWLNWLKKYEQGIESPPPGVTLVIDELLKLQSRSATVSLGQRVSRELAVRAFLDGYPDDANQLLRLSASKKEAPTHKDDLEKDAVILADIKALVLGGGEIQSWSIIQALKSKNGDPPLGLKFLLRPEDYRKWQLPRAKFSGEAGASLDDDFDKMINKMQKNLMKAIDSEKLAQRKEKLTRKLMATLQHGVNDDEAFAELTRSVAHKLGLQKLPSSVEVRVGELRRGGKTTDEITKALWRLAK